MGIFDIFNTIKLNQKLARVTKQRNQLRLILNDVEKMEAYGLRKAIIALNKKKIELQNDIHKLQITIKERRDKWITEEENLKRKFLELAQKQENKWHIQEENLKLKFDTRRKELIEKLDVDIKNREQLLNEQLSSITKEIEDKHRELITLNEDLLLQSVAFYEPKYDLTKSVLFKAKLDEIRAQQSSMVKEGTAAHVLTSWIINNSQREGKKFIKDYVKLILRAFNNECDASIIKVKFSNVASIEKKIITAFNTLNKLGNKMSIEISQEYLNLKIQELYLAYEYEVKRQEEREEQRLIKEQMREEARIIKEIEAAKLKIKKEETHFSIALKDIDNRIDQAGSSPELEVLIAERSRIEEKLNEISESLLTVEKREQNTRAGYVYIISNIGSFGENIYKIGVTRRLEPQDRIDELGGASVPFRFDVHAFIFSEDAPALENALHKAFAHCRINKVNLRKEFFNVTLEEIENVVQTTFEKPVEFVRIADAAQFRQSLKLRQEALQSQPATLPF